MLDLGSADAEGQCAESPMRAGVTVTTNDGPAGLRQPQFRTNYVNDALIGGIQVKQFNREFAAVLAQCVHLGKRKHIRNDGTSLMRGRNIVVHGCKGKLRTADSPPRYPQPFKRLCDVTSCTRCRSI